MIFFRHVLMDGVIGKPRERERAAGKQDFDLICTRQLLDAVEDVAGLFLCQHLALSHETFGFDLL